MKNIKKKVMAMMFAATTLMSFSAFAAVPAYNYSENGDFAAAVVDVVPQTENSNEYYGYSENGDFTAVVVDAVPQDENNNKHYGYSENGDYQAARA
ncbi:hypothetical protein [uncultured Megasphaera sp.]|jgi:hypothetical protein|uniref:hypothetical protein n=1 Tax=uncultured Megasphaera sp. TaxID=165188 RepID=UPI0025EA9F75|nr:hypothetical protein [uncultured Megasphaera sp.]